MEFINSTYKQNSERIIQTFIVRETQRLYAETSSNQPSKCMLTRLVKRDWYI